MKQAFQKSLALILTLALLLALPMQVFAERPIRETGYFPEKAHTDRPYSEIVFTQPDLEGMQAIAAVMEPLLDDPANTGCVGRLFEQLDGVVRHGATMQSLSLLGIKKEPANQEAVDRYLTASERMSQMYLEANELIAKIDASPCREALLDFMTEEAVKRTVGEAAAADPKEQELEQKIAQLKSGYMSLTTQAPSEKRDQAIGELYLELVNTNNQLARLKGYDNYQDYAYAIYVRDYTPEDVSRLRQNVKKYIAPYALAYSVLNVIITLQETGISEIDAVSPQVQEKIEGFLGSLSSELLESYHFMWDKGYCDFEEVGSGDQSAFILYLDEMAVPFMRINHAGFGSANENALWKLRCFIHEFGHYNANYLLPQNFWEDSNLAMDVQETHSTGLEALFVTRAEEIVGGENADVVLQEYLYNKLITLLLNQVPLDELEEYAYTTPGITADDLNRKWVQITKEYGFPEGTYMGTEWMGIRQLFEKPFYVISYATSTLATLRLWLDSLEDYGSAVDQYLTFVRLGMNTSLRKALQEAGMADPFQEGTVKEIMDSVNKEFGLEKHLAEVLGHPFMDVMIASDDWYKDAVKYVYQQGIMDGTNEITFSPDEAFRRGLLVTTLWRQAGSPDMEGENWGYPYEDVDMNAYYGKAVYWARLEGIASGGDGNRFRPSDPVTLQDFVTMLWRQAGKPKGNLSVLDRFNDTGMISGYAKEAMAWAVENSVVQEKDSGRIDPQAGITRAEAAQLFMNLGSAGLDDVVWKDAA